METGGSCCCAADFQKESHTFDMKPNNKEEILIKKIQKLYKLPEYAGTGALTLKVSRRQSVLPTQNIQDYIDVGLYKKIFCSHDIIENLTNLNF